MACHSITDFRVLYLSLVLLLATARDLHNVFSEVWGTKWLVCYPINDLLPLPLRSNFIERSDPILGESTNLLNVLMWSLVSCRVSLLSRQILE